MKITTHDELWDLITYSPYLLNWLHVHHMTGCLDICLLLHSLCYQLVPYFKSHALILYLGLLPSSCIVFHCMLTTQCILLSQLYFTDNTPCSMYYMLSAQLSLWSRMVHCTKQSMLYKWQIGCLLTGCHLMAMVTCL